MPRLVFFTIHSTTPWWKYLGSRIDFADVTVLSDLRGEGDRSLVDDFYHFIGKGDAAEAALARFGEDGCADIILRCRVLWCDNRGEDRNQHEENEPGQPDHRGLVVPEARQQPSHRICTAQPQRPTTLGRNLIERGY